MTDDEKAVRKARRWWPTAAIGIVVLLLVAIGSVASIAIGARSSTNQETRDRAEANRNAIVIGCENVNKLARAVKDLIASQGTVLVPIDATQFGFADPAVTRYVQNLIDRSQANASKIQTKGKDIKLLDCRVLAKIGKPGQLPVTLPPETTLR